MAGAREPLPDTARRPAPDYSTFSWRQLLFAYLSNPDSMRSNPLLERVIRSQLQPPRWRPDVRWLWLFPLIAVGAVLLGASSLGQEGGSSLAIGLSFAAALCAYPPYLLGSSISLLLPARVAPLISSELEKRTMDVLRASLLSPAEIALGKLFGVLIPHAGLLNYMLTFFVLIALLGLLGTGALPAVLGVPVGEALVAVLLVELPLIFGPLARLCFVCALSLAVSTFTARVETSVVGAYGLLFAYWAATAFALVTLLSILHRLLMPHSMVLRAYTSSPLSLFYPNPLRVLLSFALSPVLLRLSVRRVARLGAVA